MDELIQHHYQSFLITPQVDKQKIVDDIKTIILNNNISYEVASHLFHVAANCVVNHSTNEEEEISKMIYMLSESALLLKTGVALINDGETKVTLMSQGNTPLEHSFECLMQDITTILEYTLNHSPGSGTTVHIIGIVDLLRIKATDFPDDETTADLLERLSHLKSSILSKIANREKLIKTDSKSAEDALRPPESFRTISVNPTDDDIIYPPTFLRKNKKRGQYQNLEHYLDVQFRLYREDCIAPLRQVYEEFIVKNSQQKRNFRLENGRMYRNVLIEQHTSTSLEYGEVYIVVLDPAHVGRINWKNSKRLIYGSLIILSFDRFRTIIFGVVAESDSASLQQGRFKLRIMRNNLHGPIPRNTPGIILEATSAYFESYVHVLSALKSITEDNFLFQKYIVNCQTEVDRPRYLCHSDEVSYEIQLKETGNKNMIDNEDEIDDERDDESDDENEKEDVSPTVLVKKNVNKTLNIFQSIALWPSCEDLQMDNSQKEAFISALTNEFVLIQGPPGTGKTHIGLQIAKTLLHNKEAWNPMTDRDENELPKTNKSMLIVCYSNHALDQFLEGLADFFPSNKRRKHIVRFGGQSKSSVTEQFSIKNHRRVMPTRHHASRVIVNADRIKQIILINRALMKLFRRNTIVANYNTIWRIIPEEYQSQFVEDGYNYWFDWLGVSIRTWFREVKSKRNKRVDHKVYLHIDAEDTPEEEDTENDEYKDRVIDDDQNFKLNVSYFSIDIVSQFTSVIENISDENSLNVLTQVVNSNLDGLKLPTMTKESYQNRKINIWHVQRQDRWRMYKYWIEEFCQQTIKEIREKEEEFNELFDVYKLAQLEMDEEILKNVSVIGMTTTYAARSRDLLNRICPIITIIEEAAEVPEAHIVSAISPKCEHVVLIGDHKQLEPKTAVRELAIRYNLSLSLFERMISNGLKYHCLQEQHRMRPEIAHLVRHFYPVLHNHESVHEYKDIRGVNTNLFFVDHSHDEQYNEEIKSYFNGHEAKYLLALYGYLLKLGYKSSQITILVAYTGQLLCVKNEVRNKGLTNVKISVLDNFQGEENDIILLSLVRSNSNGDIGFLYKENRICVALSRAKMGLYIIGNSKTLTQKSDQWKIILEKLKTVHDDKRKTYFGNALPLLCENHSDHQGIRAQSPEDFEKSVDGGCEKLCEFRLNCGHVCPHHCHPIDQEHKNIQCRKICKKCCQNGHSCDKVCHYPDKCSVCTVLVDKSLPCGHKVPCHVDPENFKCKVQIPKTLKCDHIVQEECFVRPEDILCKVEVEKRFPDCLHLITVPCHTELRTVKEKSLHSAASVRLQIIAFCKTEIEHTLKCGHNVSIECGDREEKNHNCYSKCTNSCENGHTCKRQCHFKMPCHCPVLIEKLLPCGHFVKAECHSDPSSIRCHEYVELISEDCGHAIRLQCYKKKEYEKCTSSIIKKHIMKMYKCVQNVEIKLDKCGHMSEVKCWENKNPLRKQRECTTIVEYKLTKCGHTVKVQCWKKEAFAKSHTSEYGNATALGSSVTCQELVERKLACGHMKTAKCSESSLNIQCQELIQLVHPQCGHENKVRCWEINYYKNKRNRANDFKNFPPCQFPCDKFLICGHLKPVTCGNKDEDVCTSKCKSTQLCCHECLQSCSLCQEKLVHKECEMYCSKMLICGHECTSSRCLDCSGCQEICSFSCDHDSCNKLCIEKCYPCREKCSWTCPHLNCTRLCFEICDRNICTEDCPDLLPCGHKCPGYCGEPCSFWCIICDSKQIHGLRDVKKDKVVQLLDCRHSFESNMLDEYMRLNESCIVTRCPVCKTTIQKHPRYQLHLKRKKILSESVKAFIYSRKNNFPKVYGMTNLNATKIIQYVQKFQTFIQILSHVEQKQCDGLELKTLLSFADKVIQNAKQLEGHGFKSWIFVTEQVLRIKVYWIVYLLLSDENLTNKIFRIKAIGTSLTSSDEADKTADENKDELDPKSDIDVHGEFTSFSLEEFVQIILYSLAYKKLDDIEEYIELLKPYLGYENLKDAIEIPNFLTGFGVHEDDWMICGNGHVVPILLKKECDACKLVLPSYTHLKYSIETGIPENPPMVKFDFVLPMKLEENSDYIPVNLSKNQLSNLKPSVTLSGNQDAKNDHSSTRPKERTSTLRNVKSHEYRKDEKQVLVPNASRAESLITANRSDQHPQALKKGGNNFVQEHLRSNLKSSSKVCETQGNLNTSTRSNERTSQQRNAINQKQQKDKTKGQVQTAIRADTYAHPNKSCPSPQSLSASGITFRQERLPANSKSQDKLFKYQDDLNPSTRTKARNSKRNFRSQKQMKDEKQIRVQKEDTYTPPSRADPLPQTQSGNNFLQEHFKSRGVVRQGLSQWRYQNDETHDGPSNTTVSKTSDRISTYSRENPQELGQSEHHGSQQETNRTGRGRRKTKWKRII